MNISFKKTKENTIYENFVNNPTDRANQRAFTKEYGTQLPSKTAARLHQRLKLFTTAGAYNRVFGGTDNRIELMSGTSDNEPLVMKVRVTGAWRKFFYQLTGNDFLLKKDWTGDFDSVGNIYVISVNHHDYDAIR
mgnify:CR=1 FL=1